MSVLDERLRLSPSVALRPEPFGALAYHFGNRKLTFLKQPKLVEVVQCLDGSEAVESVLAKCNVPQDMWDVYAASLTKLMESDMIVRTQENTAT